MKKITILAIATLWSSLSDAQTFPIGAPPSPNNVSNDAVSAWYRGGNFPIGATPLTSNVFGTMFNAAIHTRTDSQLREKLNGTLNVGGAPQYFINGFGPGAGVNTSGYLLLGPDAPVAGGTLYNTKGAFSLLHLNGTTTLAAIELGYRPWMKVGITFTENSDLMYVGHKKSGTSGATADQTDAVISWSDDGSGPPFSGPDNMRFLFTFGNSSGIGLPNADLTGGGIDGREVMRMTAQGNIGVGPRFNNTFIPKSTYHQHQEDNLSSWMQVTNQMMVTGSSNNLAPTAINATNGFRFGILGAPTQIQNGNAFIFNQEQRHIIFSTGVPTPGSILTTIERVRITALENPTILPTGGYGVYSPAGLPLNTTRVAISENPGIPIQRPMSLLHLGYDVGFFSPPGSVGGWRTWMDIGTYTQALSDNMYVGMKRENPGSTFDRSDAVVNWGDNQTGTPATGPDNLRFIFTQNTSVPGGSSPATLADGLETGRFYPGRDTLGTFGRFGVGDFTATGVNQNPTHKIDVVGNGRFRFLPNNIYRKDTLVKKIVFVDSLGVLRWEYADSLNLGGGQIGNVCADSSGVLTSDRHIPMNNFNLYFTGQGIPTTDAIGLGYACGVPMPAKFNVLQQNLGLVSVSTIAGSFINRDKTSASSVSYIGVNGISDRPQTGNTFNIGGDFSGGNAANSIGVRGIARSTQPAPSSYGGYFSASSTTATTNYGVYGFANNASGVNYAVYGDAPTSNPANRAGYFVGALESTVPGFVTSDQMFKTDVDGIRSASEILRKLRPHTYKMDVINFPQFNFDNVLQYGFIAQEVESVLPELVHDSKSPEVLDSLGNVITPSIDYKSLNYNALIPITVQAVNEISEQIGVSSLSDQTIKTNVQNLSGSLAKVKQMRGVTYEWSSVAQDNMELDSIQHIGFIAQEIAAIEPLLTFTDDSSLMHVNYDRVVPMLVESIKDLDAQMQAKDSIIALLQNKDSLLDARLTVLENALNACCNSSHSMTQNNNANNSIAQQDVNLKDGQTIILDQNSPNPFSEQTTIGYFLSDNVVKAQMLFYNVSGKLIQSVDLNERGKCSLNVFAQDLSNGIYTYTLVVDGKIVETKKMVKQQ